MQGRRLTLLEGDSVGKTKPTGEGGRGGGVLSKFFLAGEEHFTFLTAGYHLMSPFSFKKIGVPSLEDASPSSPKPTLVLFYVSIFVWTEACRCSLNNCICTRNFLRGCTTKHVFKQNSQVVKNKTKQAVLFFKDLQNLAVRLFSAKKSW